MCHQVLKRQDQIYLHVILITRIDTVFISVTTSIATEIINTIQNKYKNVKRILFLGDLLNDDFEIK